MTDKPKSGIGTSTPDEFGSYGESSIPKTSNVGKGGESKDDKPATATPVPTTPTPPGVTPTPPGVVQPGVAPAGGPHPVPPYAPPQATPPRS
jgi:hypothetical protein